MKKPDALRRQAFSACAHWTCALYVCLVYMYCGYALCVRLVRVCNTAVECRAGYAVPEGVTPAGSKGEAIRGASLFFTSEGGERGGIRGAIFLLIS